MALKKAGWLVFFCSCYSISFSLYLSDASRQSFRKKSHNLNFVTVSMCLPIPKYHNTLVMCAHIPNIRAPALQLQYQSVIGF